MRINFYSKVTPNLFKSRGKDLYKTLNSLKNYVSQSNRANEISIVLTKHENEASNEIYTTI